MKKMEQKKIMEDSEYEKVNGIGVSQDGDYLRKGNTQRWMAKTLRGALETLLGDARMQENERLVRNTQLNKHTLTKDFQSSN